MAVRLSKRQREVLEAVDAACVPVQFQRGESERIVPLYIENIPGHLFWSERERERFVENLQARGLVRVEKRNFIYITDAGKSALSPNG